MSQALEAVWYFDTISPYAYLHLKQLDRLHPQLAIRPVPVLFAGLLKHWESKGPAELETKRQHTYRQCVWLAKSRGIPFRLPPRHPFNPLSVQRLLVASGSTWEAIHAAYDFIFGQGRDPEAEWPALCEALGCAEADAAIADPRVKQALIANTDEAIAAGVFGVPTLVVRGERFWGSDTIDWVNAFVDDPTMFAQGEMARVDAIEVGVTRRR